MTTTATRRRPRWVERARSAAAVPVGLAIALLPATGASAGAPEPSPADVAVTLGSSTPSMLGGGTATWTIAVTNLGLGTAEHVAVLDQLPDTFTVLSASPTGGFGCVVAGSSVWCTADALAPGSTATIDLAVQAALEAPAQTYTGSAHVSSSTPDPDVSNNLAVAPISVTLDVASQGPLPAPAAPAPPNVLPATGTTSTALVMSASLVLLVGVTTVVASRRRRRDDQVGV